jgi:hypothetical protein
VPLKKQLPKKKVAPHASKKKRIISLDSRDAESAYPLSNYNIPAQDQHGHTARCIVRVPPGMKNQISRLLVLAKFPWETESDFVRWCMARGLDHVDKELEDPEFTSMQSLFNGFVSAARVQTEYAMFGATLDAITKTLTLLLDMHAFPPARKILQDVMDKVDRIDDPYWHERYTDELKTRYGNLLTADDEKASDEIRRQPRKKKKAKRA